MLAFAVEEAWTRDGAEAMRIAPMALHIAIMCLARRSARARVLLHQETAACGSSALGRVDKAHPAMNCGELHEAEETFGCLVVARRDAAKLLQEAHHALDAISPGIAATVERAGRFVVRLPRNNGARAAQI
jgi:hypothetical protein